MICSRIQLIQNCISVFVFFFLIMKLSASALGGRRREMIKNEYAELIWSLRFMKADKCLNASVTVNI